jgi:hypothetical protein
LKPLWFVAVLLLAVLAVPLPVLAQLEQDSFETGKGEGSGKNEEQAVLAAKRNAVFNKAIEICKQRDLEEFSEDRVGVKELLRNSAQYVAKAEIVDKEVSVRGGGKRGGGKRVRVTINAPINITRLMRDFEKARRIAALRVYGDHVGVLLHEEVLDEKKKELKPSWDFLGAIGVERSFMIYKFRPLPMGPLRDRFRAEVEAGRSLKKEKTFKTEMVEALAAIGAHVRIVGRIVLTPAKDAKDKKGVLLKCFTASWWAEVHVGDRYHRRIDVEAEKKDALIARQYSVEAAMETAFKAAGEDMAFELAGKMADKLEEAKPDEKKPRDVYLVIESISTEVFRAVEGAIHGIEGIKRLKVLRFGKGILYARMTTTLDPGDLDKALESALGPHGFTLTESSETKVKFQSGG